MSGFPRSLPLTLGVSQWETAWNYNSRVYSVKASWDAFTNIRFFVFYQQIWFNMVLEECHSSRPS